MIANFCNKQTIGKITFELPERTSQRDLAKPTQIRHVKNSFAVCREETCHPFLP